MCIERASFSFHRTNPRNFPSIGHGMMSLMKANGKESRKPRKAKSFNAQFRVSIFINKNNNSSNL